MGLQLQFIEIKYRRHLRAARSPEILERIRQQVESLRNRWDEWYSNEGVCPSFRAVRRAKLARVLRFYAEKANRHCLNKECYQNIVSEIDRMIEKGGEYSFTVAEKPDRGWVFCPEYGGVAPLEVSPADWDTRVFLFGPGLLPDSDFYRQIPVTSVAVGQDHEDIFAKEHAEELDNSTEPSIAPYQSHADISRSAALEPKLNQVESPTDVANAGSRHESETKNSDSSKAGTDADNGERSVCLGTDLLTGSEVRWPLTVKGNPHLLVAGLPGMGKTTCLLNLCTQMLDAGVHPIVFSYHQDIDERLERLVATVRFLDFHGLGFNPLQVIDRQSRMAYLDVAGALRDIFAAIYPEFGDIQGERIRKAVKESFMERGWNDSNANLTNLVEPAFGRFVEILRAEPKPDRGLRALLGRLEELADYGFFDVVESPECLCEFVETLPGGLRCEADRERPLAV